MCAQGMTRRGFIGLVPGMALALSGCFGKGGTGPADIRWGKEYCTHCGMIIDDPRFAAQAREPGGKVHKFDDFGDGILFLSKHSWAEDPATRIWVGHAETGKWLDAREAWYVSGYKSPMAHNFGAFDARREGSLSFAEFRACVLDRGSPTNCVTRS